MTTLTGLERGLSATKKGGGRWRAGIPDGTFCPHCGDVRRMGVLVLHWPGEPREVLTTPPEATTTVRFEHAQLPAAFLLRCVQCDSTITVVVHKGPDAVEVVALPSTYGGLSTPNTPQPVAYYLDQAQRCQSVGALSAAVAMYRAALEQLLFAQGYEEGMLTRKIERLLADTNPPEWLRDLNPEYLSVIKDLGNAAIHPNEGRIEQQRALDEAVVLQLRALFVELLDDIYEQPETRSARWPR